MRKRSSLGEASGPDAGSEKPATSCTDIVATVESSVGRQGTDDHVACLSAKTNEWYQKETSNGHTLYGPDLLQDFEDRLEDEIWTLEQEQERSKEKFPTDRNAWLDR